MVTNGAQTPALAIPQPEDNNLVLSQHYENHNNNYRNYVDITFWIKAVGFCIPMCLIFNIIFIYYNKWENKNKYSKVSMVGSDTEISDIDQDQV